MITILTIKCSIIILIKNKTANQIKNILLNLILLFYNCEQDFYICPMGQQMSNIGTHQSKTKTGFIQNITRYQASNCNGCPLRAACHKSRHNRIIEVNHTLRKYKQRVKENLNSEQGIYHRKKSSCDVDPVFGNILVFYIENILNSKDQQQSVYHFR